MLRIKTTWTDAMNEMKISENIEAAGPNPPSGLEPGHIHIAGTVELPASLPAQQVSDLAATKTSLVEPETKLLPGNGHTDRKVLVNETQIVFNAKTTPADENDTRVMSKGDISGREVTSDSLLNGDKSKYEYVGEIAQGGMGRIVAMRDRSLRRKVAMKLLISPDGKAKRQQINRLLAEAQTTGQLEHPNIVPIHDVGLYNGNKYYFTMKLVKGTTLKDIFRQLHQKERVTND